MSAFAAPTNSSSAATSSSTNANHARNEFEAQRADLVHEIALGMESVLHYINRLNRNLESIIAVGNEFSSVEALWSQFENVMGTENESQSGAHHHDGKEEEQEGDGQGEERYNEERQTEKLDVKTEEEEEN